MAPGTGFLLFLIAVVTGLLARSAIRQDRDNGEDERGSVPGKGKHTLTSNYTSGMGGGNSAEWTVPKDPQEYAKRFVPKDAKK